MKDAAASESVPVDTSKLKPRQRHHYTVPSLSVRNLLVPENEDCDSLSGGRRTSTLRTVAESGDIVLFRTKGWGTKVQRYFTLSEYDHVAIVLRAMEDDSAAVQWSVSKTVTRVSPSGVYVLEALQGRGVLCSPWEDFYEKGWAVNYHDSIVLRKLIGPRNAAFQNALWDFAKQHVGNPYYLSLSKLLSHAPGRRMSKHGSSGLLGKLALYGQEVLSLTSRTTAEPLEEAPESSKLVRRRSSSILRFPPTHQRNSNDSFNRNGKPEQSSDDILYLQDFDRAPSTLSHTRAYGLSKATSAKKGSSELHLTPRSNPFSLSSVSKLVPHSHTESVVSSISFSTISRRLSNSEQCSSRFTSSSHPSCSSGGSVTPRETDHNAVLHSATLYTNSSPAQIAAAILHQLQLPRSQSADFPSQFSRSTARDYGMNGWSRSGTATKVLKRFYESDLKPTDKRTWYNKQYSASNAKRPAVQKISIVMRRPSLWAATAANEKVTYTTRRGRRQRQRALVPFCTNSCSLTTSSAERITQSTTSLSTATDPNNAVTFNKNRPFFCSELVAEALKAAGVFRPDISGATFWPVCFTIPSKAVLPFQTGYTFADLYIPAEALALSQNPLPSTSSSSVANNYSLLHKIKSEWFN